MNSNKAANKFNSSKNTVKLTNDGILNLRQIGGKFGFSPKPMSTKNSIKPSGKHATHQNCFSKSVNNNLCEPSKEEILNLPKPKISIYKSLSINFPVSPKEQASTQHIGAKFLGGVMLSKKSNASVNLNNYSFKAASNQLEISNGEENYGKTTKGGFYHPSYTETILPSSLKYRIQSKGLSSKLRTYKKLSGSVIKISKLSHDTSKSISNGNVHISNSSATIFTKEEVKSEKIEPDTIRTESCDLKNLRIDAGDLVAESQNALFDGGFGASLVSIKKRKIYYDEKIHQAQTLSDYLQTNLIPLSLDILNHNYSNYTETKVSNTSLGIIKAYAANTYNGTVRSYNEDRVAIIIKAAKPPEFAGVWPVCSFFAIYDGHGGSKCADFLKENLHNTIFGRECFTTDPKRAIKEAFNICEEQFLNLCDSKNECVEKSGSCALVILIYEERMFIANLGDSRAVMSYKNGERIVQVTNDHKPNNPEEKRRIASSGGRVYQ